MIKFNRYIFIICVLFGILLSNAQTSKRPFIWIQKKDRQELLEKIENQKWANTFYTEFLNRLEPDFQFYKENPEQFLNKFPFDKAKANGVNIPPLKTSPINKATKLIEVDRMLNLLQVAVDCGIVYFITEDEAYAQCALDIFYTFIEAITQIEPSKNTGNGGWFFPNDHLRDARMIGAQLPVIYDFIAPYIDKGAKPYDFIKKNSVPFNTEKAQNVFYTYARLAIEHGHTGSNWSVLEATSLVQNALAINNVKTRDSLLQYFLNKGTEHQDPLTVIAEHYKKDGDVYPETSGYSNAVAHYSSRTMLTLNRYNPKLKLGKKYYKIPMSLNTWKRFLYPNGELIRFGDGKRKYQEPYVAYEYAYLLGKMDSVPELIQKFSSLITAGIDKNEYIKSHVEERYYGARPYVEPLELLWFTDVDKSPEAPSVSYRTDALPHAGIYLQRNLSATNKPEDALMCFVGGSAHVHSHAHGMNMELYGLGEVMGVDAGNGGYKVDIHENYSRLFAAHNTVIVNGASQGEGGWVNLGINTVKCIAMEPKVQHEAISPNYSFTRTSFIDDGGDKAEATQERTLAIIRTSPSTGYYIDVFRSKSALSNEFHDYVYHNIGDELQFLNKDIVLKPDENRFQEHAKDEWIQNRKYRNPGWHFFKDVKTSEGYKGDLHAQFRMSELENQNSKMNLFVLGGINRDYTKVSAPPTFDAPKPYISLPTPTLIIRQNGEAWDNPFAVVFEPTDESVNKLKIKSVEQLDENGIFKGFKVVSETDEKLTQYIITQSTGEKYFNKDLDIYFEGGFAIVTLNSKDQLQDIYIGDGKELKFGKKTIKSVSGKDVSVFVDFTEGKYNVNPSHTVQVNF